MGSSLRMMRVVDSHTAGQPTRVVVDGGPQLGDGPLKERLERLRTSHDRFRSIVAGEPRGSDALVGALLCTPSDPSCTTGVIFFDSSGYLGMCGHGTISVIATLEYLGLIKSRGSHRIETPVGTVTAELHASGDVSIQNVASFRHKGNVAINVDGSAKFTGDVAWGGNWFFLVNDHSEDLKFGRVERLTEVTRSIREALMRDGITGANGEQIDSVALFGPPLRRDARSRNFILRSGKAYGRSPCGTGMSAKLACLFEDGMLAEGENWRQESIVGTVFDGSVDVVDGAIRPRVRGSAYVTAEATLIIDERDPLSWGIN
jgi:4-hydroxyproline epimerase